MLGQVAVGLGGGGPVDPLGLHLDSLKVRFHSFSSLFPVREMSGFVLEIELETPCMLSKHPATELCIFFLRIHTCIQYILITGTPHSFPLTLLFTS